MSSYKNCCRCKVRWFHSKGAGLVMLWLFLLVNSFMVIIVVSHTTRVYSFLHPNTFLQRNTIENSLVVVIGVPIFLTILFMGWLTDTKLGNYRVFKICCQLVFFASIVTCITTLLSVNLHNLGNSVKIILYVCILASLAVSTFSIMTCVGVAIQLGLDQMPDASTDNVISYIVWLCMSLLGGIWVGGSVDQLQQEDSPLYQLLTLVPVISMSIALCTDFWFSSKWLIIEPKSYETFKAIYRVLKFAIKHKSPVNRSALTYWEENIPSRLDLAKLRYGGPFTTEYVENVKAFFKLLLLCIPILPTTMAALYIIQVCAYELINNSNFFLIRFINFTVIFWSSVFVTVVQEFVIVSLLRWRFSIQKHLCAAAFCLVPLCLSALFWDITVSYINIAQRFIFLFSGLLLSLSSVNGFLYVVSVVQFVYAQSPYNMRAFLLGYTLSLEVFALSLGFALFNLVDNFCEFEYCTLIRNGICVVLSVIGFLLNCEFAKRYVPRKRDDIEHVHHWVESYYDRILPDRANPSVN